MLKDGMDAAYMIDLWQNFSDMQTRNADYNELTDAGGNTLRSLYESLLSVSAGQTSIHCVLVHGKSLQAWQGGRAL